MSHHDQARRWGRRFVGASSLAAAAVLVLSTGSAHADGFPLPDGQTTAPGVTITRTNENANVLPSLASNEARNVYVSGVVTADVTRDVPPGCPPVFPYNFRCPSRGPADIHDPVFGGTNQSSTHFASQINTGYIIGCQANISDSAFSLGGLASVGLTNVDVDFSLGVQIGPGDVKFVPISVKDIFSPGRYTIEYDGTNININGCGGRAQARAYTNVEIIGNDYAKYSLYGEPFDIP